MSTTENTKHTEEASGTLYVVATPIGNLEDFSARGIRVLKEVDLIACEDTRHTARLLSHFGISTPATSYHEHNEEAKAAELLGRLQEGRSVALVSDAGTPAVSDPGYRLIRLCRKSGVPVMAVPGPSAAVTALSVSGLPSDRFLFVGFLPRKEAAQVRELETIRDAAATLIFYLSPHRLTKTLETICGALGNRPAFLVRELTKVFESGCFAPLQELVERSREEEARGEYTLVVEGAPDRSEAGRPGIDAAAYVRGLIEQRGMKRNDAIRLAAEQLGLQRNQLYALVESDQGI